MTVEALKLDAASGTCNALCVEGGTQLRSGRSRWEIGRSVTNYISTLTAGDPALLSWARTSAPLALCPSHSSLLEQPLEQIPFNLSFQNPPESREPPGWLLNTKYSLWSHVSCVPAPRTHNGKWTNSGWPPALKQQSEKYCYQHPRQKRTRSYEATGSSQDEKLCLKAAEEPCEHCLCCNFLIHSPSPVHAH